MHTKKWILALKWIFTVQLSSLLKNPNSNLTYLGSVLIYVSDEGAAYVANENYSSPSPFLYVYRAEQILLFNFSPDCLHESGYLR